MWSSWEWLAGLMIIQPKGIVIQLSYWDVIWLFHFHSSLMIRGRFRRRSKSNSQIRDGQFWWPFWLGESTKFGFLQNGNEFFPLSNCKWLLWPTWEFKIVGTNHNDSVWQVDKQSRLKADKKIGKESIQVEIEKSILRKNQIGSKMNPFRTVILSHGLFEMINKSKG